MALAYLDPPASTDHVASPRRTGGVQAGSRTSRTDGASSRRQVDLLAIAEGFAVSAAAIAELRSTSERTWVLVAVTDLFEAWAIGWPPGGMIELHDHGPSRGAVVVAAGALTETTVRATEHGVAVIGTHRLGIGDHRQFGPHYVHDLGNHGDETAVSVHVYGPRLTTMTYYGLDRHGRLGTVRTEEVAPVGPFDTTCDHDPS